MAMQLLVGVPLEMVHGALRIGLVYVCGILAGESNSAYILGFLFVMRKCFFLCNLLQVPYYAFSDITFHVVCNIAVCECERSAKFQRAKCTTIGVIVSQKKSPLLNCLKHVISNSTPYFLHKHNRLHRLQICIIPTYSLLWLPVNNVYFDLPSKTVAVAWKSLVRVVVISRRCCSLHCESKNHFACTPKG